MPRETEYDSKKPDISEAMDEIKSVDTSKYKSHPMVEKLLVYQVEELKNEIHLLRVQLDESVIG
jgi:hypothetical protein